MFASPAGPARAAAGVVVAAVLSALGALVLGEYEMTAAVAVAAGPLLGLVVAEAAVWVAGGRNAGLAIAVGALAALGVLWGAWISSSEGLRPYPALAWVAAGLAAAFGAWRAGVRRPAATR